MPGSTRRNLLQATGVAGAVSLAGCVGGILGGGGQSQVTKYADQVREATADYQDRQAAIDDGYELVFGPKVVGEGWHFQHPGYTERAVEEGGFVVDEPPVLTYDDEGTLGSVEYGAPAPEIPQSPDLFSDVQEEEVQWGVHQAATHVYADGQEEVTPLSERSLDEIMNPDHWTEFNPPDTGLEAGDTVELRFGAAGVENPPEERVADYVFSHPGLRSLHFWVHRENTEGMFSPVNPDFAQPR